MYGINDLSMEDWKNKFKQGEPCVQAWPGVAARVRPHLNNHIAPIT